MVAGAGAGRRQRPVRPPLRPESRYVLLGAPSIGARAWRLRGVMPRALRAEFRGLRPSPAISSDLRRSPAPSGSSRVSWAAVIASSVLGGCYRLDRHTACTTHYAGGVRVRGEGDYSRRAARAAVRRLASKHAGARGDRAGGGACVCVCVLVCAVCVPCVCRVCAVCAVPGGGVGGEAACQGRRGAITGSEC